MITLEICFKTSVRQNRYYSEDWTFCENWRDMGGRIWMDKRVLLRHSGSYVFCMEIKNIYLRQLDHVLATTTKSGNEIS
jgi:hypothetical protein